MSIKITKKNLKELAESLNAVYCGGNVYNYESIIYWINAKDYDSLLNRSSLNISDTGLDFLGSEAITSVYTKQIAYAKSDMYGNIGQLHMCTPYINDVALTPFYVYYC